jgi:HAMP domain-containing protein
MIAAFGPDSYLGPWLKENRDAIATDIRNDHPVDLMLPAAAYRRGQETLAQAQALANQIIESAEKSRQKLIDDGRRVKQYEIGQAAATLRRLADQIERGDHLVA